MENEKECKKLLKQIKNREINVINIGSVEQEYFDELYKYKYVNTKAHDGQTIEFMYSTPEGDLWIDGKDNNSRENKKHYLEIIKLIFIAIGSIGGIVYLIKLIMNIF